MDTISRESNTSILPIAGIIAGLLALILACVALVKVSSANKEILLVKDDHGSRVASLEGQVSATATAAESAKNRVATMESQANNAFRGVADELGAIKGEIAVIKETLTKPKAVAAVNGKAPKEPAVAGPNEYIVKSGDIGTKIAKTNGVSVEDLKAVNPGVNWSKLKVGDKVKLPAKK